MFQVSQNLIFSNTEKLFVEKQGQLISSLAGVRTCHLNHQTYKHGRSGTVRTPTTVTEKHQQRLKSNQMNDSQALIEILINYELYINTGNEALKKNFNLIIPPLLAKRQGLIPISGKVEISNEKWMTFTFHGMGCKFEFENIIVDFDYTFVDFVYSGFEKLKLYRFLKSYSSINSDINEFDIFNDAISKLENEGIIKRNENESINTYDYIFLNPTKQGI